jgi:hypothetical protein
MAIATITIGVSKAMYETVSKEAAKVGVCPGQLLHFAAEDAAGKLTVVDLWESTEDMKMGQKKLMAAYMKAFLQTVIKGGGFALPKPEILEITKLTAYPLIEPYFLKSSSMDGS